MSWTLEIRSGSVADTIAIGRALGAVLKTGDFVALVGVLGAGKTHLIKGIASGLGVADERRVNSPTFVLVNEYVGRCPVFHLDAYRLSSAQELEALGIAEMQERGALLLEWADRAPEIVPPTAAWIDIAVTGDSDRQLSLRTEDGELARRLASAGLDQRREKP